MRFKQVYVEITNQCNLSCPFCPRPRRAAADMSVDLFARTVKQLLPLTEQIYLHVLGEPLRHPHFESLIGVCHDLGMPVSITTNGTLVDSAAGGFLVAPPVRQVNFSLHSLACAGTSQWRVERLSAILDFASLVRRTNPELYINFRLWNLADLSERDRGGQWNKTVLQAIETAFQITIPWGNAWGWKKGRRLCGRLYLNLDTCFDWPEEDGPELTDSGFCHGLGTHFGILADGTVVPCCLDRDGVMALGNCGESPLDEILASPRATAILGGFRVDQLVEPLCRRCSFRMRFDRGIR